MGKECKNCGIRLIQKEKSKPKKYCSNKCRFEWWNRNRGGIKEGTDTICANCGIAYAATGNKKSEYCSQNCYITGRFGLSYQVQREEAIKLQSEGYSYSAIAKIQGVSINTVKSRVRRYFKDTNYPDRKKETKKIPEQKGEEEPEFTSIEFCALEQILVRRIFLMCGPIYFRGKIDAFITQIPQVLEYNLMIGDVFVYCNRTRLQLSVLQWQGTEFALMFRRTENERYPWPNFETVRIIEITESDMHMLIEYPKFLSRLSGIATPQILV